MDLTQVVYIVLVVIALIVLAYWFAYTRRIKTLRNVGTQEGIAVATLNRRRNQGPKSRF